MSVRTTCPYCGVGCGVVALPDGKGGAAIAGDPEHPANRGRLCSKGAALGETLGLEDRLLHPEIDGQRFSWETALDTVASGFRDVIDRYGPDAVAFYVSGQLLTEDYYVANKLIKGFLGTANIDTNSRLCMASSVAGHKRAFGSDTMPGCYEDFEQADLAVLVGSNLAWCHPVLFQRLESAKRARPDLKIVVIDPRRTETCGIADLHLALKPGSDVALFNGLLASLQHRGVVAADFIERHTSGLEAALAAAHASDVVDCDLPAADVATFFDWFARTEKTVTLYSQGVNQSSAGVDKVNALINCHLLTGRVGRPGMGPFSITGQPNAMGGREVGALSNTLAAHMDFAPADVERVRRFWKAPRIATRPGLKAVELFDAVGRGEIKAVWIMATNPVASLPNADAVQAALQGCEYAIVSEAVRASDTVDACRIRLPALAWAEKDGTVTNSERRISRQRPFLPAPGEARPDWRILSQVARRLGHGNAFAWNDVGEIFREHAALSAFENDGTRDFEIAIDGLSYDTLAPFTWGKDRFFADGGFFHADGRARFVATVPRAPAHAPTVSRPLRLNTGRVRDQWHTMTRTGKSARLAGHRPEPTVELHPRDASARDIAEGAIVAVESGWGRSVLRAHLSDAVRPGEAFAPMHWTAQVSRAGRINSAVNPAVDPVSGQPELKHTPVEIRALDVKWHGTILARRALMLPQIAYWVRLKGAGHYAYLVAGEQPLAPARKALAAAIRTANPGPWLEGKGLDGEVGLGAVIADGRLEAVMVTGESRDDAARDRLAPFMAIDRLTVAERNAVLRGGDAEDRGGEMCACFGVSCHDIEGAIAEGAGSLEAIGEMTRAGTNCGSCRPEIRLLLRAHRAKRAA
ncbi:MAG: molybdopterin-dependent oxidoreductase [Reyranella sp.]|uniref:nitrate reductase n=1 Tax=Reyranella sp. TaxID=1929291 RepID=UPI001AC5EDCB|nr:nitrate reductase [Reyranella sp.]MBN9090251.1 molybdopterin-dependent oxidoreductase [Reyranella sp.]